MRFEWTSVPTTEKTPCDTCFRLKALKPPKKTLVRTGRVSAALTLTHFVIGQVALYGWFASELNIRGRWAFPAGIRLHFSQDVAQ